MRSGPGSFEPRFPNRQPNGGATLTTGKYAVGRTSFHWIDAARAEAMTDDPDDRRELMVTLWYPAEPKTAEPAPYIDHLDKLAGAMDQLHVSIARSVRTHTVTGARLSTAEPRYPVLMLSHPDHSGIHAGLLRPGIREAELGSAQRAVP